MHIENRGLVSILTHDYLGPIVSIMYAPIHTIGIERNALISFCTLPLGKMPDSQAWIRFQASDAIYSYRCLVVQLYLLRTVEPGSKFHLVVKEKISPTQTKCQHHQQPGEPLPIQRPNQVEDNCMPEIVKLNTIPVSLAAGQVRQSCDVPPSPANCRMRMGEAKPSDTAITYS